MAQPVAGGSAPTQQPRAILRGHKAQVHAAVFIRGNERLVTGDADGFVVVWDLTIMRPRAVWRAHEDVMLGIRGWGHDRLITHGRDNKLIVWKFGEEDEAALSQALPLDPSLDSRPQPWILHVLEVNTMNFCTFSLCRLPSPSPPESPEALIAVPNTLASEAVDIYHLPSQRREHTVGLGDKDGMVMALELFRLQGLLTVVVAYENGTAVVAQLDGNGGPGWTVSYRAKVHSQPILSLDVAPSMDYFLTSSADALISKHPLQRPVASVEQETAEGHGDAVSTSEGAPGTNLATVEETTAARPPPARLGSVPGSGGISLLSSALSRSSQKPDQQNKGQRKPAVTEPLKTVNTKHAGQQGLRIRSDGRIFATAGWDSRVRVYSCKTMKELAVLKWHQVGCYALAFTAVGEAPEPAGNGATASVEDLGTSVAPRIVDITVKERRIKHARAAHWLAAGAKDGKVSLWEVY